MSGGRRGVWRLFWQVAACMALCLALSGSAWAQLNEAQLAARRSHKESFLRRFRGSLAALSTYMGSGTFVLDNYSNNPFVSQELLLRPRLWVGEQQNLQLLWLLECEYTEPDGQTGHRCSPSDMRLSYHHINLWQDPWIEGRLMGSLQVWLPTSYESQSSSTVMNLRASLLYLATVLAARLQLSWGFSLQKYLPSDKVRSPRDDSSGGTGIPVCLSRPGAGEGACGSGGPLNDNWLLINALGAQWYFQPNLWLSLSLSIWNFFRYSVDELGSDSELPAAGRADLTWGTLELGYQWRRHYVFAFGLTSRQPALTADGKAPRFPFWDFVSPSNNFSRFYATATWVY